MNKTKDKPKTIKEITFHHIKSDGFKTVFITGATGGATVNSLINMNLYTDRTVIPSELTFEIDNNVKLGKEIKRVSKQGVIRDVQVGVLMDLEVAKNLIKFLNDQIAFIESNKLKKNP